MAEQFRSITETRKELPSLSQTVQSGGDRYVITNQGKPQAVLLGYSEYKGLLAAAELLSRPKDLAHLEAGLAQTERIGFDELKENLRSRRTAPAEAKAPVAEAQMAAAPLGAIAKKLDEIKEYLEKILEQPEAPEPVYVLAQESLRPHKRAKGEGSIIRLGKTPSREFITAGLVKHDTFPTAERKGRAVIAAKADLKAGR